MGKNHLKNIAAASAMLCFAGSSFAEGENLGFSRMYEVCMDISGGVTVDMHNCMGAEHEHQDKRLNQVYRELIGKLPPDRQNILREGQRAWIKYRDASCEFYSDPDGGTASTMHFIGCHLDKTARRAAELEGYLGL